MAEKKNMVINEILFRINEHARRIRLLEERVDRIVSSIHILEEEVKDRSSEIRVGLERRDLKIKQIMEEIDIIKKEVSRINEAIEKLASKSELNEIKNFIEILNPITSKFVTRDEVKRMLEDFNSLKSQR